ncbi:uncharacterized protein STEHIDRAFT_167753 [Stereum hirsutum FP-91666 SS1]|uniref:uncharacterized protein n=1 Tax=Stereum hirsutum (strain FP-91666) TaxID=721885 RepID=UPI000440B6AD|nr:uncharacterized protein STEHIDRAFT_167753 [Stereum hirsutum FP-91666 SS1]EIM88470.1 hypothetical protein STEHIDRAFT_167753 [Stereum hirsutum FP-91666 SS1]
MSLGLHPRSASFTDGKPDHPREVTAPGSTVAADITELIELETFSSALSPSLASISIPHKAAITEKPPTQGGYFNATTTAWLNVLGSAADVATNVMGDELLLYRCYMIWGSNIWIILFPSILYVASTAMAIVTVVQSSLPGGFILDGKSENFGVPWVTLTVSLNIILTSMICGRLLFMRRQVRSVLSPEMASMYTNIMAILIESALPFTLLGIAFLVTYVRNDSIATAFAFVWGAFCAISPQMILLRVAMGRGWTSQTVSEVTGTMAFAPPPTLTDCVEPREIAANISLDSSERMPTTLGTSTIAKMGSALSLKNETSFSFAV